MVAEKSLRSSSAEGAGAATEKFDRGIDKVAFKVELHTDTGGKESLRWRGMANGQEAVLDAEPCVGFGSKAAVRFFLLLPVEPLL